MKKRLSYLLRLGIFWVLFFLFIKFLFLIYHYSATANLPGDIIIKIFVYGLRLDLSMTGYLLLLPIIFLWVTSYTSNIWQKYVLDGIFYLFLFLIVLINIVDFEIYKYWGFHMDKTPLLYLRNPREAFASVSAGRTVLQILLGIVIFGGATFVYKKLISKKLIGAEKVKWYKPAIYLLILAFMFIPIRGSFGVSAVNISSAYFCEYPFANHAAINETWNFAFSLTEKEADKNPYQFYSQEEEAKMIQSLLPANGHTTPLLNAKRPNILLIIVEGLAAKNLSFTGGWEGVTPNLNSLAQENIYFENFYANGDRTDKGLVAILGSFPAQPQGSIIKFPHKTAKLPQMSKVLADNGYHNHFYYGGDVNFANMRAFLNTGGFYQITDKYNFPASAYNSKWGVHDHVLLDTALQQLKRLPEPFFTTLLTLSSHEPFDVPHTSVFSGDDEFSKYRNSVHYTDSCLGAFLNEARKSPWWNSTLIIITADHGTRHPRENPLFFPGNFKIPMIWSGGAVGDRQEVISTYGSQTDIAATVLKQLQLPAGDFIYSRDLLSETPESYAFYAFHEGFGMMTDTVKVTLDLRSKSPRVWQGNNADSLLNYGRAYLQWYYGNLVKL